MQHTGGQWYVRRDGSWHPITEAEAMQLKGAQ